MTGITVSAGTFYAAILAISPTSDHPMWEWLYWISQTLGSFFQFLLVVAAIVGGTIAYRQVEALKLFELSKFLQDERFREARRIVIREIGAKQDTKWWDDPRLEAAASTCAGHYDVLGNLLEFRASNRLKKFFIRGWGESIVRTYQILSKFISQRRASGGNEYWAYERLYNQAKKRRPSVGPNWPPQ